MSASHKSKAEPVTVSLTDDLRTRLDAEAVRLAVAQGRPCSRSAATRLLLERALADQAKGLAA